MNAALWVAQASLAVLFLWAGGIKLVLPLEQLVGPVPLPGLFLRFIGVAEVAGALGLVLPGVLGIRPSLTPLAAAGLTIIMIGATAVTLAGGLLAMALVPAVVGILAGLVAYGRWRLAPLGTRARRVTRPVSSDRAARGRRRPGAGTLAMLSVVVGVGAAVGYGLLLTVPVVRNHPEAYVAAFAVATGLAVAAVIRAPKGWSAWAALALSVLLLAGGVWFNFVAARIPDAPTVLRVGERPPDFTLPDAAGRSVSLADYRGRKPVVLIFYRGAW
jgi:hypothetical protein